MSSLFFIGLIGIIYLFIIATLKSCFQDSIFGHKESTGSICTVFSVKDVGLAFVEEVVNRPLPDFLLLTGGGGS